MSCDISVEVIEVVRVGRRVFPDTPGGNRLARREVAEKTKIIPGTPKSYARLFEPEVRQDFGLKVVVGRRTFFL